MLRGLFFTSGVRPGGGIEVVEGKQRLGADSFTVARN
jgi:hypothetical protein